MKKILTLILTILTLFTLCALSGCSKEEDTTKETIVVTKNADGSTEQIVNGIKIVTVYQYSGQNISSLADNYAIVLENTLDHPVDLSAEITFKSAIGNKEIAETCSGSIDHLAAGVQYVLTVQSPEMHAKPYDIDIDVKESSVQGIGGSDLEAAIDFSKGMTIKNNADTAVGHIDYCIMFSDKDGKLVSVQTGTLDDTIKPGESITTDTLSFQKNYDSFIEYFNGEATEN